VRWYHYLGYFMGGAFLVNAIPHFVSGVMGHPFQSPFATPPGEGLSPAWVNVLWGSANLIFAYVLLARLGNFRFRCWRHVLVAGIGALAIALLLAHSFGRFYVGLVDDQPPTKGDGIAVNDDQPVPRKGESSAAETVNLRLDEKSTEKIAEIVLVKVYGPEVLKQRPWNVATTRSSFKFNGTLPHTKVGGVAEIEISKHDAAVKSIGHGK
jgi:hypothetical protein